MYRKEFDSFNDIVTAQIYSSVRQVIKNLPQPPAGIQNDEKIAYLIAAKADKFDLEKVSEEKANKV